jgi:hypothetical protein
MKALKRDSACAAGQLDAVGYLSDGADICELLLVTRHEQYAILVADIDCKRQRHAREDDDVFQWN